MDITDRQAAGTVRPVIGSTLIVGAVAAFVSLLVTPWFSATAHNTHSMIVDIPDHWGTHHSLLFWALFIACLVAAGLTTSTNPTVATIGRVAAPTIAVWLIFGALIRVALMTWAGRNLPPGLGDGADLDISPSYGLAITVLALAIVAIAAASGVRRSPEA